MERILCRLFDLSHSICPWRPLPASWKICDPYPQPGLWLFMLSMLSYTASWTRICTILGRKELTVHNKFFFRLSLLLVLYHRLAGWIPESDQASIHLLSLDFSWITQLVTYNTFRRTHKLWLRWDFLIFHIVSLRRCPARGILWNFDHHYWQINLCIYHEIPLRDKQCVRFSIHVCVSFLIHSDETKARMGSQVIKQTSVPH